MALAALIVLIVAACGLLTSATVVFAGLVWRRRAAERLINGAEAFLSAYAAADRHNQI